MVVRGEDYALPYLVLIPFLLFLTSDFFLHFNTHVMATLGASGSSNTSPRWGGVPNPGSAFSGLSRGRGRGRGAAGRGGRGRARGGLSEVDIPSTKPDNSQSSTSMSTKSSISPSLSTPTPGNVPLSKPKSASRRGSRAIPVTAVSQIESVVTPSPSTPTPAKVTHKRKRSQVGRPARYVPPKANPPELTDSLLRSNKLHIESHAETLKDIPPHLNSKFDVRNDIDALVERVRAVAMDNRPSTPKSHIDWAVDDDDTLPDLDDWGVTTSTLTQLEGISPIIVDGLRSLPEFAAVPSPLKQVEAVMVQPTIEVQSSLVNGTTPDTVVPTNPPNTKEEDTKSKFSPEFMAKHDPVTTIPSNSKITSSQLNPNISLHPSLPAKPLSVDSIVQPTNKSRHRASPMRFVPHPKSPIIPMVDLYGMTETSPAANSEQADALEPVEIAFEMTDHKTATRTPEPMLKDPEHLIVVEPSIRESVISNVGADNTQTTLEPGLSGLGASMHAPKGIVDSVSAPANLSTYADSHVHDPIHTHTRAHTIGRSAFLDSTICGQGDYMTRVTRSGHTTPRSGFQGTSHARTHSTPPGGANRHRSPHTSRPVITGDAISRLARTIVKTHNNISPPISHSAVTPDT